MKDHKFLKYRVRQNGLKFQPESFTEVLDLGIFGQIPSQIGPIGEPVASLDEARAVLEKHIRDREFNQAVYHSYDS